MDPRKTIALIGRQAVCILLVLGFCLSTACQKKPAAEHPKQLGVEDYGRLPGLQGTSLKPLRDELSRIVVQQGTPELLDGAANVADGDSSDKKSASDQPRIQGSD